MPKKKIQPPEGTDSQKVQDTDAEETQDAHYTPYTNNVSQDRSSQKTTIYLILGVVLIILIGYLLYSYISSANFSTSQSTKIFQNHSANSTSIYLGVSQVQIILNSQLAEYNATDLYNLAAPVNISYLNLLVPQIYGNVTSGWITLAHGSNTTTNASLQYSVLTTKNAKNISNLLSSSYLSLISASPISISPKVVTSETQNGLNYTYRLYSNSTFNVQLLSGWKGNNAVLALIFSNHSFTANQTQFINTVANDTPYS